MFRLLEHLPFTKWHAAEISAVYRFFMRDQVPQTFVNPASGAREHWRSVVLFGRNVASYKFALAKSLLEMSTRLSDFVTLEDLAVPFSRNICEHLLLVDRQGTFERSRFLDACRFFNAGRISDDELRDATKLLGFNNVIDAFHVVGSGDVPTRFFIDERNSGGIRLTESFFQIAESFGQDLIQEAESRWRLVEESWESRASGQQVVVLYDAPRELLVPALQGKRRSITEVRPALNGYQKGHCFYCFRPISLSGRVQNEVPDIDHFFPHVLMSRGIPVNLDSPWNLVLSCTHCNRGSAGKFASLPHDRYLERIFRRNEYLISSNHPLRETLIEMTGADSQSRQKFLRNLDALAVQLVNTKTRWRAKDESDPLF